MSGIAGTLDLRPGLPSADELVRRMTDSLVHRGPVDEGIVVDAPVVLGHRRLSAFDSSPAGAQPLSSPDGALWITYDGEVYNHPELAAELRELGHRFHGSSDAEVVLHAYAEWGPAALQRLNGVFAFAVWDRRTQELFCARDRFGLKPFYYTIAGGRFRFASEIKALLVDPDVRRLPNDPRVLDFLTYGITDHTAETMLEGIRQLRGGCSATVTPDGIAARRWYRVTAALLDGRPVGTVTRELLSDAVALRLRGDAPVGVGISGGVDSSSLLVLAARLRGAEGAPPPPSFSVRTADPRLDEWRYAESVLRATGSPNSWVKPEVDGVLEDLPRILWQMDEPFHSLSVLGHWRLMELAAAGGVGALIEGQAGDDIFSGVHTWYPHFFYSFLRRGRGGRALAEARARRALHGVPVQRSAADLAKLLLPHRARARRRPPWIAPTAAVPRPPLPGRDLKKRQVFELTVSTLPAFSREVDRNSTSFGIKARAPFLDHRVVEFGFALPPEELMRDGWTKWPLREAVRGIVPDEIVDRRDKQGFSVDQADWMRGGFGDVLEEAFASESLASRPYFDPQALSETLAAHRAGDDRSIELWRAFVVEQWLRMFVDAERIQAPAARPASSVSRAAT